MALFLQMETVSPFHVGMGDLSSVRVRGRGTLHLMMSVNERYFQHIPKNVLYLLNPSYNLVFVGLTEEARNCAFFDEGKCLIGKMEQEFIRVRE